MNFSKKSWLFWLAAFHDPTIYYENRTNFCEFFRAVLGGVCKLFFLALGAVAEVALVCGGLYILIAPFITSIGLPASILSCFMWGAVGILTLIIVRDCRDMMGHHWLFKSISFKFAQKKRKLLPYPPSEFSKFVTTQYKAWKDKVCPTIIFVD